MMMGGRGSERPRSSEGGRPPSMPIVPIEASGGIVAGWGAEGVSLRDTRPVPFWALITGQASGTNRYAWTQVNDGDSPDFRINLADGYRASGTSDTSGGCAYEINGRTNVLIDGSVRVLLHPAGDWSYYLFEYSASSSSITTAGLETCAWPPGLRSTDCVYFTIKSATGRCSGVSTSQAFVLQWDGVDGRWESGANDFTGTGSGGTGQVTFDNTAAIPTATIDGIAGTYLGCDGNGGILYSFGDDVLCGNTAGSCNNYFIAKFACNAGCCDEIAGWGGPGWYCVRTAGTSDPCEVVELIEGDQCDVTIEICSGPYESASDAAAVCGPDLTCVNHVFSNATLVISEKTGTCTCFDTNPVLSGQGTDTANWDNAATSCGVGSGAVALICSGGEYLLSVTGSTTVVVWSFTESPWQMIADVTITGGDPCTGSIRLTITDP